MQIRSAITIIVLLVTAPGSAADIDTSKLIKWVDAQFSDVYYPVAVGNWWGGMNGSGRLVIYPGFEWTDNSSDNWVRVVYEGKTGYIRAPLGSVLSGGDNNSLLIEPQFDWADRFAEKYAAVGNNGKVAFINVAGRPITDMVFDEALRFREGYAAVRIGDGCGFIDVRGQIVIQPGFARVRSFHEGMAMVQRHDGTLGYITKAGRYSWQDTRSRFNDLGDYNESLAKARIGEKWGYIDKTGRVRIDPRFDDARDFTNGFAAVQVGTKWGYIDKTGKLAIPPRFDDADDFDETLAMIVIGDKFGFINKTGKLVLPARYDYAEPYSRRYARVGNAPWDFGYIDVAGNVIWDPIVAEQGFVDVRTKTRVRIAIRGSTVSGPDAGASDLASPVVFAPPARPPSDPPYPPEYLYDEVLPQP